LYIIDSSGHVHSKSFSLKERNFKNLVYEIEEWRQGEGELGPFKLGSGEREREGDDTDLEVII
jgi:hypothetical protein